MPADVLEVTKKFMREPVRILVKKEELTLEGIRQFYINVEKEVRKGLLSDEWRPVLIGCCCCWWLMRLCCSGMEAGHSV